MALGPHFQPEQQPMGRLWADSPLTCRTGDTERTQWPSATLLRTARPHWDLGHSTGAWDTQPPPAPQAAPPHRGSGSPRALPSRRQRPLALRSMPAERSRDNAGSRTGGHGHTPPLSTSTRHCTRKGEPAARSGAHQPPWPHAPHRRVLQPLSQWLSHGAQQDHSWAVIPAHGHQARLATHCADPGTPPKAEQGPLSLMGWQPRVWQLRVRCPCPAEAPAHPLHPVLSTAGNSQCDRGLSPPQGHRAGSRQWGCPDPTSALRTSQPRGSP